MSGVMLPNIAFDYMETWKKYRVLLNRVDTSTAPDIEWPTVPIIE
ncbi:TPA: tail fiber assembly protein [Escherichia coli]|nr:tail fiber assembly protein [Escherichia coli]HDP9925985.1 tail fiber assembly protein [Escherichia coli]HDQ1208829.1 tail fiber assembly protein [Escherichia coli]